MADGLTFLTWNLAMMQRSISAPVFWDESNTESIVRDVVLDLEPQVVMYQELPALVPFVETHKMIPANPRSHSGNLATLIRAEVSTDDLSVRTIDGYAILTTFANPALTIANVHLMPGRGAAPDRLMQITKVIDASPTKALLIVGDTNTRIAEAEQLVSLGFSADKPPVPTWDSQRNKFHSDIPEFSAYFTRWFASPGVTVDNVVVHDQPTEHSDKSFFVSDHYALSGRVVVA